MYAATAGYPYFIQAYGKVAWDVAPRPARSPPRTCAVAAPEAEAELAVGFFGSRYERATPAEREYLRAMADAAADDGRGGGRQRPRLDEIESVPTSSVAAVLDRKPQSLSPARDALLKKGLIYCGERGRIAFTVPHFGRYLRGQRLTDPVVTVCPYRMSLAADFDPAPPPPYAATWLPLDGYQVVGQCLHRRSDSAALCRPAATSASRPRAADSPERAVRR